MRVLLSTYGSRGDVEPMIGLAVRLRAYGAEAVVCAPVDCADRLAEAGVPLVPVGRPVLPMVHGRERPTPADVPRIAAELIAAQFQALAPVAADCDAVVTSGLTPVVAGATSVAELLGIPAVHAAYCPVFLPSPHHRPLPLPGHPVPADVSDPAELDRLSAASYDALFAAPLNACRAAVGLPPVAGVRAHVVGDRPWLAADPVLAPWPEPAYVDVVRTGALILPDERPLPADLERFLDAGAPPVFVGYGSMPLAAAAEAGAVAVEAARAHGRRVVLGRGWAGLAAAAGSDVLAVGEANQHALVARCAAVVHHGGAGTTTTAARAGAPQVVVPQMADQPYWAGRVAALGVGTVHPGPTPAAGSLAAALEPALAPPTRARAAAVAGTVGTGGADAAARLLLERVAA